MPEVICATGDGHELHPQQSRGEDNMPRKEFGDVKEEEADEDALLVKSWKRFKSLSSLL